MKATFGEYIKLLRTSNGLTLKELAALLKLDSANLSKIENGIRELDEKRLDKLASVFSLDIEKLKVEYFGDKFAKKMYENNCAHETLIVAEEKIKYLKSLKINNPN